MAKKEPLYLSRPRKIDQPSSERCPICHGPTIGLTPINLPSRGIFGCDKCKLRLTGLFFVHQKPISQTTICPLGHPVNPADSLAPGEPPDSERVGWVSCPECKRNAEFWQPEVSKPEQEVSFSKKEVSFVPLVSLHRPSPAQHRVTANGLLPHPDKPAVSQLELFSATAVGSKPTGDRAANA